MTRRCSDCGISYPISIVQCMVCGQKTDPFSNVAPDADWREKVDSLNQPPDTDWDDAVPRWRFAELLRAGYAPRQAEELATRASWDVDLQQARELAAKAGPELAYEILS